MTHVKPKARNPILNQMTTPTESTPKRVGKLVFGLFRHPAASFTFLALAIAFFSAWKLQIVPMATVWGDLGTWVAAVFTGGGLIFAGVSAKSAAQSVRAQTQARKDDERDKRTAMAHAVAVSSWWATDWNGTWCVCYRIVNKSPYPISQVTVRVWDLFDDGGDQTWTEQALKMTLDHPEYDGILGRVVGTMLPDDELFEAVRVNHPKAGPRPFGLVVDAAAVQFVDVWGKSWSRTDTQTKVADGPDCMCQGCIDMVPDSKIIPLSGQMLRRPTVLAPPSQALEDEESTA
jgi:hypothetical protein